MNKDTTYVANFAQAVDLSKSTVLRMIERGEIRAWRAKRRAGGTGVWKIPFTEIGRIQDLQRAARPESVTARNGVEYRNDAVGNECGNN